MKYLILFATFFIFELGLNAQSIGVTVVSESSALPTVGGVEDLNEDMEVNGGVEDWNEDMEVNGGVEDWNEDMEVNGGVEDWNEDMEVNGGVEDWNEDMELIMNGCNTCSDNGMDITYYDENGNEISFENFNGRRGSGYGSAYVIIIDRRNNTRRVIRFTF